MEDVPARMRSKLGITCFPHPAHSPDLNVIENIWSNPQAAWGGKTRRELIEEERALIPIEQVNHTCESIGRRVQEVKDTRGYATGH